MNVIHRDGGVGTPNFFCNSIQHTVQILSYIIIGKTQESNPELLDPFLPCYIFYLCAFYKVTFSVKFDCEFFLCTIKIYDIFTNTKLAPELCSCKLFVFQSRPQDNLCIGHCISELFSSSFLARSIKNFRHCFSTPSSRTTPSYGTLPLVEGKKKAPQIDLNSISASFIYKPALDFKNPLLRNPLHNLHRFLHTAFANILCQLIICGILLSFFRVQIALKQFSARRC